MSKKYYWVYILHCQNNSYYTGYTTDLENRYQAHLKGIASKYTRSFKPISIAQQWKLYCEKNIAMKIEREIKKLSRSQKQRLIAEPELLKDFYMQNSLLDRIITIYLDKPRVGILMSGHGSNADAILSERHRYPNVNFVSIITDKQSSNALQLSKKHNLEFYFCEKNKPFNREEYFKKIAQYLDHMKIDTLIYAGFMMITPSFFVHQFPGINIHPADLTLCDENNKPKYIGMDAVKQAMMNQDSYIASTAHVVDAEVDCGSPILVSKHLDIETNSGLDVDAWHEKLKVSCEHTLFPKVIELLSKGLINSEHTPYQWNS